MTTFVLKKYEEKTEETPQSGETTPEGAVVTQEEQASYYPCRLKRS